MNTPGKWLARAGALLVLLGFVLPVMTVSCGGMSGYGQSFSLLELGTDFDQVLLFGTPLGVLVALVFTFLPANNPGRALQYLIAQAGGVILSVLCLLIAILNLNSKLNSGGFTVEAQYGAFFLIVGYILALVGLVLQWMEKPPPEPAYYAAGQVQEVYTPPYNPAGVSPGSSSAGTPGYNVNAGYNAAYNGPRLELVRGTGTLPVIVLTKDDFSLGRGSQNDMQIPDPKVSREHLRLRYAQGYWYLQDQNSTGGTYVNGKPEQACRLNAGDEITIGDTTFIFKA